MSAGWRAGAARRWQAAQRLPDRVPLRIKLITAVLALVAIALIAISVAGISFLRSYLISQQDSALRVYGGSPAAAEVASCYSSLPCPSPAQRPGVAIDFVPDHGTLQRIWVPISGYSNVSPEPGPAVGPYVPWLISHPGQPITVPATSGSHRWRVIAYHAPVTTTLNGSLSGTVITALDLSSIYQTIGRLVSIDLVVSAIVIAALAMIGVTIVRTSLRPLTDIERTAGQIASGDLARRVPERDPRTEVGRLGRALNAMLAQIEAAFRARAQSEAAARRSEERLRQFVADASHELRTPVTVIRGYAEYYRQRGGLADGGLADGPLPAAAGNGGTLAPGTPAPGPAAPGRGGPTPSGAGHLTQADIDRMMERVEREAARMGGLVEDMLLLARLDAERPVERRPVDLLTLSADVVADARVMAPGRQIDFTVQPGTAFLVLGDAPRLRQVISNLMNNALTHTPDGTPVSVRLRTGQPRGRPGVPSVILEVADSGPGLTKEQAERVFERFYRTDQARRRRTGGTGLGLAIVAALVAAHGGTVSLDTAPGEGATFSITLPLAPEAQTAGAQAEP